MIHLGDCLEVMAGFGPESVDAIVTDPPYGLEFMGKEWDKLKPTTYVAGSSAQSWHQQWAEAAYRVAKPSAYLLAFGGTRTVHRMTVAIEDAGWIIRDMLVWAYASGFPKSKASLKPAWEPIVMARKPGPLRELAIDLCRIGPPLTDAEIARTGGLMGESDGRGIYGPGNRLPAGNDGGRWPSNLILTDPIFDGGWDGVVGGGASETSSGGGQRNGDKFGGGYAPPGVDRIGFGDSGTYSRYFLVPKADRADREPGLDPFCYCETASRSTPSTGTSPERDGPPTVAAAPVTSGGSSKRSVCERCGKEVSSRRERFNAHPT